MQDTLDTCEALSVFFRHVPARSARRQPHEVAGSAPDGVVDLARGRHGERVGGDEAARPDRDDLGLLSSIRRCDADRGRSEQQRSNDGRSERG
ncbi:hypothetical protein C5C31_09895 [Rathayibacter rathayi]|nr:hypothetical protein C5C02_08385 [Rathayibacter rathayi]PPG76288.1 hypothetical protein C5C23_07935 [Rathayibacter rathayi]PPG88373.1 hypothetical protein C5C47_07385 [Rathayibacter rathayi]PPG96238.1 hypothetical protein C5C00_08860 [Rathayibacter rathayi]PPH21572.1 hypothetical protein C5C31_09895 [Rathayibacter rathayi]